MPTHALHHSELPAFAAGWPAELAALIEAQLDSEIPSADLRTITLAPTNDRLRFGVWLGVEWEDYPYAEDADSAAGFLSLSPWLDTVDAIARGETTLPATEGWQPRSPVRFTDAARSVSFDAWWRALHDALVATAIEVGTKHLAGRFKQPVGLFVSPHGQEARLVSFCHAQGAPLWPLQEHRKEHGYGSAYPTASWSKEQLVIFYPEGEGDDEGAPAIRAWAPADVVSAREDRSDDELQVRFRGEDFDVTFSAGHTQDESGGPDKEAVMAALRAWFGASGALKPDGEAGAPPLPATVEALSLALEAEGGGDKEQVAFVRRLAESHGPAALSPLVSGLAAPPATQGQMHRALSDEALDLGDWALALHHIEQVTGKDRWSWMETRALVGLGRWEAVLKVAEEKSTPERALAMHKLGRTAEGLALLKKKSDSEESLVRAVLLAKDDPDAARASLRAGLLHSSRKHLLQHVEQVPALRPALDAHAAMKTAIAARRDAATALAASTLDTSAAVRLATEPPDRVLGAPLAEEDAAESELNLSAVLFRPGAWWAGDRDGALLRLVPGQAPETLATFSSRIERLAPTKHGVVVATDKRLFLVDDSGQMKAEAPFLWRGDGPLATRGDVLAVATNDVVHLYRVEATGFTWLGCLAMPGESRVTGLGFLGDDALAVTSSKDLLIADVRAPAEPSGLWRATLDAKLLETRGNSMVLALDGEVLFAEWTDGWVRCTRRMKSESSPLAAHAPGTNTFAIATRGALVVVDGAQTRTVMTLGPDGYPLEAKALALTDAGAAAVTSDGLLALTELPLGLAALEASVEAALPLARPWLQERVAEWVASGFSSRDAEAATLGGLVVQWYSAKSLCLQPQHVCSVVSTVYEETADLPLTASSEEREANDDALSDAARQQARGLQHAREQQGSRLRRRASRTLAAELVAAFRGKTKARDLLVGVDGNSGLEVVDVVAGGGDALPRRAASTGRAPKSLQEQMASSQWYTSRGAWVARARRDEAFRAEVLTLLAKERLVAADRVASEVLDVDAEGCARAYLAAAEEDVGFALGGLCALAKAGHAGAKAFLVGLVDVDDTTHALMARRALGRMAEPATTALMATHLEGLDDADDVPENSLSELTEAQVTQLRPHLEAAFERLDQPDALLASMARAGWAPNEKTLKVGNKERANEDDFMAGILGDEEDNPKARAIRLWVARRIAEGLDGTGPLWPEDVPVEKKRVSWQRFFAVAWPLWEARGVLGRLFAVLPDKARAACVSKEVPAGPDGQLAFQALYQSLLRGVPEAEGLGQALESVPFDDKARADVFRLARLARLQFGWGLVKAKRLVEARRVADAALADAPTDGQVLFYDARVAWLEQDDPNAATPRITAGLKVASDDLGRARLLNLQGAVLDALGRPADALEWFHKAFATNESAVNPDTGKSTDAAMGHAILSNIAEAHWKLGQRDDARRFAERASRLGSTTDIVKEILAAEEA